MRLLLITLLILALCGCEDTPPPVENETRSLNLLKFKLLQGKGSISSNKAYVTDNGAMFVLPVSQSEFDMWNKGSVAGWPELMQGASKEFYKEMKDEFDFLFFVVDNEEAPSGVAYGSQVQTKNTIDGLGLDSTYDVNNLYGSAGRLQSAITLWKNNLNEGPILHEMGHRWMNFVLDTPNPSHWSLSGGLKDGTNPGVFQAAWNNFADVELYLMGLIPASEVTDHVATLNEILANHGERSPAFGQAQTDFRGAIILITTKSSLSDSEINNFTEMIEWVEDDEPRTQGINWARQTGGRGNLDLSGLSAFKK